MSLSVLQIAYYPTLLQTRQVILEHDGYSVVSALGNDQGMAIAATETFDVIVVGFSASHATRTSMVRWLKQHAPMITVVALLAHDLEEFPDADCVTLSENPMVWLAKLRQACAKNSH